MLCASRSEVAVAAGAGRNGVACSSAPDGSSQRCDAASALLCRLGAQTPRSRLDAPHRRVRGHDLKHPRAEHDRPAMKGARDIPTTTNRACPASSLRIPIGSKAAVLRRQAARPLGRGPAAAAPRSATHRSRHSARMPHRQLKPARVQRFNDALKRRMLIAASPSARSSTAYAPDARPAAPGRAPHGDGRQPEDQHYA